MKIWCFQIRWDMIFYIHYLATFISSTYKLWLWFLQLETNIQNLNSYNGTNRQNQQCQRDKLNWSSTPKCFHVIYEICNYLVFHEDYWNTSLFSNVRHTNVVYFTNQHYQSCIIKDTRSKLNLNTYLSHLGRMKSYLACIVFLLTKQFRHTWNLKETTTHDNFEMEEMIMRA